MSSVRWQQLQAGAPYWNPYSTLGFPPPDERHQWHRVTCRGTSRSGRRQRQCRSRSLNQHMAIQQLSRLQHISISHSEFRLTLSSFAHLCLCKTHRNQKWQLFDRWIVAAQEAMREPQTNRLQNSPRRIRAGPSFRPEVGYIFTFSQFEASQHQPVQQYSLVSNNPEVPEEDDSRVPVLPAVSARPLSESTILQPALDLTGNGGAAQPGDPNPVPLQSDGSVSPLSLSLGEPYDLEYPTGFSPRTLDGLPWSLLREPPCTHACRKPLPAKCPICLLVLLPYDAVWCKPTCGTNFHDACMLEWLESPTNIEHSCPVW